MLWRALTNTPCLAWPHLRLQGLETVRVGAHLGEPAGQEPRHAGPVPDLVAARPLHMGHNSQPPARERSDVRNLGGGAQGQDRCRGGGPLTWITSSSVSPSLQPSY